MDFNFMMAFQWSHPVWYFVIALGSVTVVALILLLLIIFVSANTNVKNPKNLKTVDNNSSEDNILGISKWQQIIMTVLLVGVVVAVFVVIQQMAIDQYNMCAQENWTKKFIQDPLNPGDPMLGIDCTQFKEWCVKDCERINAEGKLRCVC